MIGTTIFDLFSHCSPPAIVGGVIAVRVNPIQSKSIGTLAHILKEIGERVSPTVTNRNATTAIVFVCNVVGIIAARFHHRPRRIRGRRGMLATGTAMLSNSLHLEATATALCSGIKRTGSNNDNLATRALTRPHNFCALVGSAFDNSEATKDLLSKIDMFSHAHSITRMANNVE